MRRFAVIAAIAAIVLGTISCNKIEGGEEYVDLEDLANNPFKEVQLSTKSKEFARQGNTFAFDFIDRVSRTEKGDFIISPISLQLLLGMILDGAQGQTADEICKVLGYGAGEADAVNEFGQSMMQQLPSLDKRTKINIANSIFVNQRYPVLDSYKSTIGKYYQAEAANLDFSDPASTLKAINGWCSEKTKGLIPKVLDDVSPQAVAYLLNALYFNSQWQDKFPKENTASEIFTTSEGSVKKVPMMKDERSAFYYENDEYRILRLSYGNAAFSMKVILPADGKTLSDVTEALKSTDWYNLTHGGNFVRCEVDVWLPKFETKYEIELNKILSDMGMPAAFSPKADFSALSETAFFLSLIKQDAVIKVDEERTEAAAVSMTGWYGSAGPLQPGQHIVFHADQPFLYVIDEWGSGSIIFAGRFSGK